MHVLNPYFHSLTAHLPCMSSREIRFSGIACWSVSVCPGAAFLSRSLRQYYRRMFCEQHYAVQRFLGCHTQSLGHGTGAQVRVGVGLFDTDLDQFLSAGAVVRKCQSVYHTSWCYEAAKITYPNWQSVFFRHDSSHDSKNRMYNSHWSFCQSLFFFQCSLQCRRPGSYFG